MKDETPWLDIHKMSESQFETFLWEMPRWAESLWNLVKKHGDFCDWVDARAFFNHMSRLTGINYRFWENDKNEEEE